MPKKVLVTEPLAQEGLELLRRSCEVTLHLSPSPEELLALVADQDALIVRSATKVTAQALAAGKHLTVVGRAGTGVDNIDLAAATRRGIVVVNAPTANTVAVAEHTVALMLCLARRICQANALMHAEEWKKSGLLGTELRGKALGLVGLGRVGAAVAARARGLEMRVLAYDPFITPERAAQLEVELVALDDLLARTDYVSLHAPATERTRGMIGARELGLMKPSARLINCARGDLIVEEDLIAALQAGRLAGAALDVFADEPRFNPAFCQCPNLLLTPHLGASTAEAQSGATLEVVHQVIDALEGRTPRYSVNLAALSIEEASFLEPYLDLANRLGRFYAQYAENHLTHLELTFAGDLAAHDTAPLTAAALAGLLSETSDDSVNLVNAHLVARDRGVVINEVRTTEAQDFAGLITLRACSTAGEHILAGTVMRGRPHVVRVDDFWFDFVAEGRLLVSEHVEQPGVIGQMGLALGEAGVSISFVQVGRRTRGGYGVMVLGLDDPLTTEARARIMALPSVRSAKLVSLLD